MYDLNQPAPYQFIIKLSQKRKRKSSSQPKGLKMSISFNNETQ